MAFKLNLPIPNPTWSKDWQTRYSQQLTQADATYRKIGQDISLDSDRLFIKSPNGTEVQIIANDDGTVGPVAAAAPSLLPQDNTWTGTNTFDAAVTLPAGTVTNANMAAGAAVANIGYTPVQQAGGPNQINGGKVNIGGDTNTGWLRGTFNGSDQGIILTGGQNKASAAAIQANASNQGLSFVEVNQMWAAAGVHTLPGPDAGTNDYEIDCSQGSNHFYGTGISAASTFYFTNYKEGQSGVLLIPGVGQDVYFSFSTTGNSNIWTANATNNNTGGASGNNFTTTPFQANFTWYVFSYCIVADVLIINMIANA